jgi:hypothetical protein
LNEELKFIFFLGRLLFIGKEKCVFRRSEIISFTNGAILSMLVLFSDDFEEVIDEKGSTDKSPMLDISDVFELELGAPAQLTTSIEKRVVVSNCLFMKIPPKHYYLYII